MIFSLRGIDSAYRRFRPILIFLHGNFELETFYLHTLPNSFLPAIMMILRPLLRRSSKKRQATAAVEMAVVLPFLLLVMFGVWEIGRLVHLTQIVSNAAREGGRLSAAGTLSASTTSGTNPTWQIQQAVGNYLQNAGFEIPSNGVVVTVTNLTKDIISTGTIKVDTNNSTNVIVTLSGTAPTKDPVLSADQYDTIKVEVSYPFSFARWSPSNLFFYMSDSTKVYAEARWPCMRDKPVAIDSSIPQKPLP
jgi:Flp pilus assembly protein TadG